MIRKFLIFILLAVTVSACDMIEYHPYDLDIAGETGINSRNCKAIGQRLEGKEEISFAVISDTQRWYDETADAVDAINRRDDIDFVLHAGDLSDFGAKLEFVKQRDILNRLKVPYVCILGNHDCVATGEMVFNKIFGENNFAFTAGNVRFICLNTNALEFDYSEAVPDFSFIAEEIRNFPETAEKTVVAMHARYGFRAVQQQRGNHVPSLYTAIPGASVLRLWPRAQRQRRRLLRRRNPLLPVCLRKKALLSPFPNHQRQLYL